MLLVAYFGWAKPVPVNPRNYRNYKQGEAIVSLAGVTMNLLLAIIFSIAFVPVYRWVDNYLIRFIIEYGISLNVVLMLFNLLPLYPLDGYHIFELLFARRLPMNVFLFLRRYGQYILIAILILCRVIGFHPISLLTSMIIDKLITLVLAIG